MSKLADLKKWFTVPEAIEKIKITMNQTITESDLYQLAIHNEITLSTVFPNIYDFNPDFYVLNDENLTEQFKQVEQKVSKDRSKSTLTLEELEIWERTSKFDQKYYRHYQDRYCPNTIWNIRNSSIKPTDLLLAYYHATQFNQQVDMPNSCLIQSPDQTIIVRLNFYNLLASALETFQFIIEKSELDRFINTLKQDENKTNHTPIANADKNNEKLHPRKYNNLVTLIGFLLKHPNEIPNRIDDHTIIIDKLLKSFQTKNYKIYEKEALTDVIKDALRLIQERESN
ncbi:hypothetical protein [Wohlfahrtiimonas larvae]|uniref:Uncharacterized protein n=1 Tax=Wohlfahrtiimonas larvae TaxID=1157986 RepID=A0ABP9MTP0_9GAMM|nr:hypothetical protein [Wohlfahrtiimonas larvae]